MLFDQLGMPKTKRTKTGYTTDAEALADLYTKTEHPFLRHLLRHRDATRLRQTVEGLLKSVADDGRIHTTYQQTIAATGRLSSTDPNLQNIPIRTEEGRRIRRGVRRRRRLRVAADRRLLPDRDADHGAPLRGRGPHRGLPDRARTCTASSASRVFGVPADEVTPAMRSKIKAMSYGLAYGLSAFGLSQQLTIDAERGARPDGRVLRRGSAASATTCTASSTQARRTGYTETILGRRRYLPDLTSDNRQRREMAERMALNAPIQGSAADIIKVAMLGVDRALTAARPALAACCCRSTTSSCSRSPTVSGSRRRPSCAQRWRTPPSCRCRWTSPSVSALLRHDAGH